MCQMSLLRNLVAVLALGWVWTFPVSSLAGPPEDCCAPGGPFGDGALGDIVITEDTALASDVNYHNLTVAPGVTLDTRGHAVRVCGKLTNYGVITDLWSGGPGGPGGAGGLGANPAQDAVPDDCGARSTQCTAGSSGQPGAPGGPGAGSGGRGGSGGSGGGGAQRGAYDADGGNGGAGGAGGKGGGYVEIHAFRLENFGVIHADGFPGQLGQDAPEGYYACGAEYEAWPSPVPTNDLAGGGGGGGGGGNGGDGGTVHVHYAVLHRLGEIHAWGGPGGPGGAGAPPGGSVQFGALFGSWQEGCAANGNGGAGGRGSCQATLPPTAGEAGSWGSPGLPGQAILRWQPCGYTLTELSTLGGAASSAEALNDHGLVAGYSQAATGRTHATLWINGFALDLHPAGAPERESRAYDVNEMGQVAGCYQINQAGDTHAFLWLPQPHCNLPAGLNDLGTLPSYGPSSCAYALNDDCQVVGWSGTPGSERAFLWLCESGCTPPLPAGMNNLHPTNPRVRCSAALDVNNPGAVAGWLYTRYVPGGEDGVIFWETDIWQCYGTPAWQTLSWLYTVPTGINDDELVVGYGGSYGELQPDYAFLCAPESPGVWTCMQLPNLGGNWAIARAINNQRQVVGASETANLLAHACLWVDATPLDLNELLLYGGAHELVDATDVNERGQIAGRCRLPNGNERAALVTPCPCPGSVKADANCDGVLNAFDIDAFVVALADSVQYWLEYPQCNWLCACDVNCDGYVNAFDIDPFVQCLVGP